MSVKMIQRLRQQRAESIRESRTIVDLAESENRDLTADESAKIAELHTGQEEQRSQVVLLEEQRARENDLDTLAGRESGRPPGGGRAQSADGVRSAAFRRFLKPELVKSTDEIEKAAAEMGISFRSTEFGSPDAYSGQGYALMDDAGLAALYESRAQSIVTATKGPELIPRGFMNRLEDQLLAWGGVREVVDVIRTNTGATIDWPTGDQTTKKGKIVAAEHDDQAEQELAFGTKGLLAHLYESGVILIPNTLIEDSAIDIEGYSGGKVGEFIGRIQNEHFTTGTGVGEPQGLTVGADASGIVTVGLGAITGDEFLRLKHSVNRAYRKGARFMFSDATLLQAKMAKDGNGNYLWKESLKAGTPDTIDTDPYTINDDMPSLGTANAKAVLYGDMKKYKIRDVRGIRVQVLRELYARKNQIAVLAFFRSDGKLINSSAIKSLANAAV